MTVDDVTLFFALLAIACELAVAGFVILSLGARLSPALARARDGVANLFGPYAFTLALLVATVATAGSLYLSEVAHFVPCRLCWFQRGAMYPLVPVLAVAVWRQWFAVKWAVLGVAVAGGSISTWHIAIENFPSLETSTSCDPDNPCSLIWVRRFGYLTIPTMALSGFAAIAMFMLVAHRAPEETAR